MSNSCCLMVLYVWDLRSLDTGEVSKDVTGHLLHIKSKHINIP